jgi:hypothetical protein
MSNLLFILIGLAIAGAIVATYILLKKKKTGEVVKDAQLEAVGLGKESDVAP